MMKIVAAAGLLVAVADAALVLSGENNFLQMGMKTRRVGTHISEANKASASAEVDWKYERAFYEALQAKEAARAAALAKGIDIPEVNDDDEMIMGENGEIKKDIIQAGQMGMHEWDMAEADKPDPRTWEGEDQRAIDADDESSNFGEDDEDEYGTPLD